MSINKVAIIGCGSIGQGWAVVFARAGFEVAMYDKSHEAADQALKSIEKQIAGLVKFNLVDASDFNPILKRITVASSLKNAVNGATYIQENGPEQLDFKRQITEAIDALVPKEVPIGSSTSGIIASRYCKDITGRHRCLVVHPINPPHLIPAVEIVPTPWTDQSIISTVNELMIKCGRETIVLHEEIDGFVVNRLQGALLEEAFKLIGAGIVSASDLDRAICDGLGLRWSFMGPMQTIHLNAPGGIAQYVERYADMYRKFQIGPYDTIDWTKIVDEKLETEFEEKIPLADIPAAQDDRDRLLMALLRHKAKTGADT